MSCQSLHWASGLLSMCVISCLSNVVAQCWYGNSTTGFNGLNRVDIFVCNNS